MQRTKQENNRNLKIWLPLILSIVLIAGVLIGLQLSRAVPPVLIEPGAPGTVSGQNGKIEELLRYIESKYVDDIDRDELVERAIQNIMEELDPHSSYIPADELRHVNEQLEGNFVGVGIEYMILEDTLVVVSPLPGGPSEEVGILPGDKIVEVNDSVIAGMGLQTRDVINMLRGEKGSRVKVGVLRGQGDQRRAFRFTITRDEIPVNSLDAAYMLDEHTGYIKINRFSATTYEEFMRELENLVEKQGMQDLVVDLRQNPGGYLQQATKILSQLFRQKDQLLVYTEGQATHRTDYATTGRNFFPIGRLAVLIDEGSASASEILAGAVQDHDRGIIVGRRSFGKGLVQEQYLLKDGSALRLTVARFYTPSGRSIQKPYGNLEAYQSDLEDRYENGELITGKYDASVLDSTRFYTDNGRVVFGGGGIQPDVFVPMDSQWLDQNYLAVMPYIREFVYRQQQDGLLSDGGLQVAELTAGLSPRHPLVRAFRQFVEEEGVALTPAEWSAIHRPVSRMLAARIGGALHGQDSYYRVLNSWDPTLTTALDRLQGEGPITGTR